MPPMAQLRLALRCARTRASVTCSAASSGGTSRRRGQRLKKAPNPRPQDQALRLQETLPGQQLQVEEDIEVGVVEPEDDTAAAGQSARSAAAAAPAIDVEHWAGSPAGAAAAAAAADADADAGPRTGQRQRQQQEQEAAAEGPGGLPPLPGGLHLGGGEEETGEAEEEEEAEIDPDGEKDPLRRKAAVLLKICASGRNVEATIAQYAADIDEAMLEMLEQRMETARVLEERGDVLKGMQLLWDRLHAEMQRQRASPALRLLDQLLDVLDPGEDLLTAQGSDEAALDAAAGLAGPGGDAEEGSGDEEEERERALATQQREDEAVALMVAAFSGGEASGAGDVFQLAAMLAEGGESAVERVYEDLIPADVFVAEVAELLEGAYFQQQQGLEQLKDLLRLLDQGGQGQSQGGALSEQQWRAAEEEAVALRSVLLARDASLACVARVLELAVEARRRMFQ